MLRLHLLTTDKKSWFLIQHIRWLLLFGRNYEQPVKFIGDRKMDEAPQENFPINEQKNMRKYDLARKSSSIISTSPVNYGNNRFSRTFT